MRKEQSPWQTSRWGWGSRQDRFALLYLGFVMLMGLPQHACSRRNQLTAPLDVFPARLFTLLPKRLTAGHGTRAEFWSVARNPQNPHSACPSASPLPHKQACRMHSSVPPSFQPPAQSLPPCSPQLWMSRPQSPYGTCPGGICTLWGAQGGGRCWAGSHMGVQTASCGVEASLSPPCCFQCRGTQKGNRRQLPGWFCLVWA